MPVTQEIPPLVQGMSQQAAELRNPSALDLQVNAVSDPVHGMGKRPGTQHVRKLSGLAANRESFVHWIERDANERYVLVFDGDELKAFDLNGVGYPVIQTDTSAVGYLSSVQPRRVVNALTVSDRTYLSSQEETVRLSATQEAAITPQALVWVRAGNYGTEYGVKIDAITAVIYTTLGSSGNSAAGPVSNVHDREDSIKTSTIADRLVNGWTTADSPEGADQTSNALGLNNTPDFDDFTVTLVDDESIFLVEKTDGSDFDIKTIDSVADSQLGVVKNSAESFADLPPRAPHGYMVNIKGLDGQNADDYWVRFAADDESASISKGVWEEAPAPGTQGSYEASTMPRALDRKQDDADGTVTGTPYGIYFELIQPTWSSRPAGDADTNPPPSFVGGSIDSMFLMPGRLTFASGSNIIASRVDDFGQFFKTSALSLTDDDRIDATINIAEVINVKYAVPQTQEILLIGAKAQVSIPTDQAITPANFRFSSDTNNEVDVTARPAVSNRSMFLPFLSTEYSGVREHSTTGIQGLKDSTVVTQANPNLIKGSITQMTAADEISTLFMTSEDTPQRIYVYRWLDNGSERVQSALSYWTMGDDVLSMQVIDGSLWLLMARDDGVMLEKLSLDVLARQDGQFIPFRLDRFAALNAPPVATDDGVVIDDPPGGGGGGGGGGTGGAGTGIGGAIDFDDGDSIGLTTEGGITTPTSAMVELSIPYEAPDNLIVVSATTGERINYEFIDGDRTRLSLPSEAASSALVVGVPYSWHGLLGKATRRVQTGRGLRALTSGRLQVDRYWIQYNRSGPFDVFPVWGDLAVEGSHTVLARIHDVGSSLATVNYQSGTESVPVYEESGRFRLGFRSDSYWPCWITGASWEGNYFQNAQPI